MLVVGSTEPQISQYVESGPVPWQREWQALGRKSTPQGKGHSPGGALDPEGELG